MAIIDVYLREVPCALPVQVGVSAWQLYRIEYVGEEEPEYEGEAIPASAGGYPYKFVLREIQAPETGAVGVCVYSMDFEIAGETPDPSPSIFSRMLDLNDEQDENYYSLTTATSALSTDGKYLLFALDPEGVLFGICIEDDVSRGKSKGDYWVKDQRMHGTDDEVTAYRILSAHPSGDWAVGFRSQIWEDGVHDGIFLWSDDWGDDEVQGDPVEGRFLDESGDAGSSPAGLRIIDRATGDVISEWVETEEVHLLGPAVQLPYYKYETFTWSPGDDPLVSLALTPRPYGSMVTYESPDYIWTPDHHDRWTNLSIRWEGGGEIAEWSSIGAGADHANPFEFVNGDSATANFKQIIGTPDDYYAKATQTVTLRYIATDDDSPLNTEAYGRGSQPNHSLTRACTTPVGTVYGPRGGDRLGGFSDTSFANPVDKYYWACIADNEKLWTVVVGGEVTEIPVDVDPSEPQGLTEGEIAALPATLARRDATVPLCVGDKILTVVQDYDPATEFDVAVYGPVRLIVISTDGALLEDRELVRTLWGESLEDPQGWANPHHETWFIGGKFVVLIQGRRLIF